MKIKYLISFTIMGLSFYQLAVIYNAMDGGHPVNLIVILAISIISMLLTQLQLIIKEK